ncbi:hypothetical protein EV421DRAFT_2022067 [Armillaria borealis]|uniref:Uncharacterized protein n=1 Tax=Armillaria borealis TaxID=47425 RepID=A0AA39MJY2_9AGAR|nr:hypothetical protein EV421DRAFT_2022067 [Armillaria borealis]
MSRRLLRKGELAAKLQKLAICGYNGEVPTFGSYTKERRRERDSITLELQEEARRRPAVMDGQLLDQPAMPKTGWFKFSVSASAPDVHPVVVVISPTCLYSMLKLNGSFETSHDPGSDTISDFQVSVASGNTMSPSHYPPLHIAPLPSTDSSGVSLLDDYGSSKPQTRVSYGGRKRISIAVIVPGIFIFIASAGLASALLIWLQSRRVEIHIPREDQYFINVLVAIEGTTAPHTLDDGSLESDTTMYGLAMSSLSAQLVAFTVPFLLGLLGYRLASMWILAQEKERTESMPTAAQYGLLVKLCGSANLFSAYETMRYLKRGRERRSQAPSSLIFAFAILAIAIVLNHLLSHCAYLPGMFVEGFTVIGNSSSTSRSVMVDDMAVLVPSTMPDNVDNLTFNSFGLVAHCQPVVDCLVDSEHSVFRYPSFNPPYNISVMADLSGSGYSSVDMLNLTNNALSPDPLAGYPLDSILNPYGALVILYLSLFDDVTLFPADNSPGWYLIDGTVHRFMGTCNMTAYNVSLSYSTLNGSNTYAFADRPVPSNFNTTSALFAALNVYYQTNLVDYLKHTLRTSFTLSTEEFNTVLSRNMSYAALGLASPLFERDMSTGGNTILLRSASRYPLAPLSMVLAILYTYAFLALVITASSVMLSSREIIVAKNGGKEHRVTAIELVQLRLTNPLASIAERFVDPARPELLLETSAVDMFHEHPQAEKLGVVMVDDKGEDGEGMVRRRRTL